MLEALRLRIRSLPISDPPLPWKRIATVPVGGLTYVGFSEASPDFLMAVSHSGRGVFDCRSGERVGRDPSDSDAWLDEYRLRAKGTGPLEGELIRIAGRGGGCLPRSSPQGYWAECVALDWPETHALLGGPGGGLHCLDASLTKLATDDDLRAFGFSSTGQTLVVATGSGVTIYRMA